MAYKRKIYKETIVDTNECFVCDDESDITNLPTNAPQGSSAFVISTSKRYMINSSGVWTQITAGPEALYPFGILVK